MNKTDFSPIVRVSYYSDPHMGYGDAGTAFFTKVTEDMFTKEVKGCIDGSTYNWYTLNDKGLEYLTSKGFCHYSMNWSFSSEDNHQKELAMAKAMLSNLELK